MKYVKPSDWIEHINSKLVIIDGKIQKKDINEVRGQKVLALENRQKLVMDVKADLVIEGICSTPIMQRAANSYAMPVRTWPMGQTHRKEEPPQSWLHAVIADEKPSIVIVYAECCGNYSDEYQAMINELFPDITWYFPSVRDYCENVPMHPDLLAEDMLRAHIVRLEDVSD